MQNDSRLNNFDLIRLLAAGQVVLWHGIEHLKVDVPVDLLWLLGSFPGVPIFFFVSGYLVAASFRRKRSLGGYFSNRALRIFPGLWVCFVFTVSTIVLLHDLDKATARNLIFWIVPNLVGLAQTPWFLKSFGSGSVNGSLWTIPVELQFYLALPLLVWLLARNPWRWMVAFSVALLSGMAYLLWLRPTVHGLLQDALLRSLPSWLYLFMVGMVLEANTDWVKRWLTGKFIYWLFGYLIWIVLLRSVGVWTTGNDATPLSLLPLAGVVVSGAFTARSLSERILKGNDISYGVYLYHMPVVNTLIAAYGAAALGWAGLLVCVVSTTALAVASWQWVERPALRLKANLR